MSSCCIVGAAAFFGWLVRHGFQPAVTQLVDASYADDMAHVFGCSADQAVDSIRLAGHILWEVFTAAGFRVNWGPQKTACLVRWRGKNAAHSRALLEQELQCKVSIMCGGSEIFMHCVRAYKHMGSVTTDTEIILPEIRLRTISTANRARGLRKKVFQNPLVSKEAKVNVLQALLITRNTYHVGTWPILHHREYQAFKVAIIRL